MRYEAMLIAKIADRVLDAIENEKEKFKSGRRLARLEQYRMRCKYGRPGSRVGGSGRFAGYRLCECPDEYIECLYHFRSKYPTAIRITVENEMRSRIAEKKDPVVRLFYGRRTRSRKLSGLAGPNGRGKSF